MPDQTPSMPPLPEPAAWQYRINGGGALGWSEWLSAEKAFIDAMPERSLPAIFEVRALYAGASPEWEKLRDPAVLHANLLRGIPAKLSREQLLHLAGADHAQAVADERVREATDLYAELREAASNYVNRYALDEADDEGQFYTGCSEQQHKDARRLLDSIRSLPLPTLSLGTSKGPE